MNKKLSKLGKTLRNVGISTAFFASVLTCNATTFDEAAAKEITSPNAKYLSAGQETGTFKQAVSKYSTVDAQKNLFEILRNDLNKMTGYTKLEAEVQKELASLIVTVAKDNLDLATACKACEYHIFKNSGLNSVEEATEISRKQGAGTDNETNAQVARATFQHFLHTLVDTYTLNLLDADEAEYNIVDEHDNRNEFYKRNTTEKHNLINANNAVLNDMEKYLYSYYQYESALFNGNQNDVKLIEQNFKNIKNLVTKQNISVTDENELNKLFDQTATNLFQKQLFPSTEVARGFVIQIARLQATNNLLTKLQKLNYNININPEILAKAIEEDKDFILTALLATNITNTDKGISFGLTATSPLNKNWDLTHGIECNTNVDSTKQQGLSQQVLGTVDFSRKIADNHAVSVGATAGLQFDAQGTTTPFGAKTGYEFKLNDKVSFNVGFKVLKNVQRSITNFTTSLNATVRLKNILLKFGINIGRNWEKEQNAQVAPILPEPAPQTPVPPIYGENQGTTPGNITESGNINDLEETPVDLSQYM